MVLFTDMGEFEREEDVWGSTESRVCLKKKKYVLAMLNLTLLDIQDFHDVKQ